MDRNGINVVGGVYLEYCMRPHWGEIYGSAGRAASSLAAMGREVRLTSFCDSRAAEVLHARAALEGFAVDPCAIDQIASFSYLHGLDTPQIRVPMRATEPLKVDAEHVVRFGMLEGDAVVTARRAVYDPQNVRDPKPFHENGSTAVELALVLNRYEAETFGLRTNESIEDLAKDLLAQQRAAVVVIKLGPGGALVTTKSSCEYIPAYETNSVWKIGSGDVFVAQFALHWLTEERSASDAAERASRATAYYCSTRGFVTPDTRHHESYSAIQVSQRYRNQAWRPTVYLAGPFFSLAQLWLVEQARADLIGLGVRVFSPYHDVGHGTADDVVEKDLDAIRQSDLVLALADGLDSGTLYEIGYARALGKPVIVYTENETEGDLKMMQGSQCILCNDYVSAIYRTLWTGAAL